MVPVARAGDDKRTIAAVEVAFDSDPTGPAVKAVNPSIEFTGFVSRNPHHINVDVTGRGFFSPQGKIEAEPTLEQPEGEEDDEGDGAEEMVVEEGHTLFLSLWWRVMTAMKTLALSGKKKKKPAARAVQPAKEASLLFVVEGEAIDPGDGHGRDNEDDVHDNQLGEMIRRLIVSVDEGLKQVNARYA